MEQFKTVLRCPNKGQALEFKTAGGGLYAVRREAQGWVLWAPEGGGENRFTSIQSLCEALERWGIEPKLWRVVPMSDYSS